MNTMENYDERDRRLRAELEAGRSADPERDLFMQLLTSLPEVLAATPYLHDVSWGGGRFDLLFWDGHESVCAAELKEATRLDTSGSRRKNRRGKRRQKKATLIDQTGGAYRAACDRFPEAQVRAVALWLVEAEWQVLASLPKVAPITEPGSSD